MSTLIKKNGEWKNTKTLIKNNLSSWITHDLSKSFDFANYLNVPVNARTTNYITLASNKMYFIIIQLSTNFEGWLDEKSATPRTKLLVVKNNNIIIESGYTSDAFTYTVANDRVTVTNTHGSNCVNLTAIPVNKDYLSLETLLSRSVYAALAAQQTCSRSLDHDKIYYIESALCLRPDYQTAGNELRVDGFIFEKGTLTRVSTASHVPGWVSFTVSNDTITIKNNQYASEAYAQRCSIAIVDITGSQIATYIKVNNKWWRNK